MIDRPKLEATYRGLVRLGSDPEMVAVVEWLREEHRKMEIALRSADGEFRKFQGATVTLDVLIDCIDNAPQLLKEKRSATRRTSQEPVGAR